MTYPGEEFSTITLGVLIKRNVRVNIRCATQRTVGPPFAQCLCDKLNVRQQ